MDCLTLVFLQKYHSMAWRKCIWWKNYDIFRSNELSASQIAFPAEIWEGKHAVPKYINKYFASKENMALILTIRKKSDIHKFVSFLEFVREMRSHSNQVNWIPQSDKTLQGSKDTGSISPLANEVATTLVGKKKPTTILTHP